MMDKTMTYLLSESTSDYSTRNRELTEKEFMSVAHKAHSTWKIRATLSRFSNVISKERLSRTVWWCTERLQHKAKTQGSHHRSMIIINIRPEVQKDEELLWPSETKLMIGKSWALKREKESIWGGRRLWRLCAILTNDTTIWPYT